MAEKIVHPDLATAKARLQEIKARVTAKDRKDFVEAGGASFPTIANHLNGIGNNLELMIQMLEFFTPRIEERIKKMESLGLPTATNVPRQIAKTNG